MGQVVVPPDSTGKKIATSSLIDGPSTVERQHVVVGDPTTLANLQKVTPAGAAYIQNTDGTNFTPAMDAVARPGFQKITDGTNTLVISATGGGSMNLTHVAGTSIVLGQTTMAASLPVVLPSNQSAVPGNVTQIGGAALALGQTTMANSIPVTIPSNQSNLPSNIAAVGGTALILGQTTMATSLPVVIASNQASVPVTLPGNQSVNVTQIAGTGLALGQTTMVNSIPVVLPSNQSNVPINVAQVGGATVALGQTTMASSVPVTLASNQANVPTQGATTTVTLSFTSAAAPGTTAGTPVTGLGPYRSMSIYASLVGATGGALDVYIQYSPDGGATFVDYAHFAQVPAGAAAIFRVWTVSKAGQQTTIQTVGTGTSPALTGTTIIGGDWGDRLRIVQVAGAGTTAGAAQVILIILST